MGREISSIALYLRVSALGIIETLNIIESMVQVHFGSKADIATARLNVHFTPESGHWLNVSGCLLCAKSGHCGSLSMTFVGGDQAARAEPTGSGVRFD